MNKDYKPWKNYGYDKDQHAIYNGDQKGREKYLLAKSQNPKPSPDMTEFQNNLMKRRLNEERERRKEMGESDNYAGDTAHWNRSHELREHRLYGERTERNRKKAFDNLKSGTFYKPTKCSKCGVTFPNQSAYQHHIDNDKNWQKSGVHHGK